MLLLEKPRFRKEPNVVGRIELLKLSIAVKTDIRDTRVDIEPARGGKFPPPKIQEVNVTFLLIKGMKMSHYKT